MIWTRLIFVVGGGLVTLSRALAEGELNWIIWGSLIIVIGLVFSIRGVHRRLKA